MKVDRIFVHSLLVLLLFLPGCGNSRDIQNLAYVTALGVDYVNGKYVSYVQVLNFSNIARSEDSVLGKPVPIWIGVGDGQSLSGSLTEINATSQYPLFWGHLKSVVVTERALKQGVAEICSTLNRNREIRYNILVYGTKDNLTDILTQKSIFNLSPLDTIMFTGVQMSSQKSFLVPLNGNHAIANLHEKGNPAMIPSIAISKKNWREDHLKKGMFMISGAYFFENERLNTWMPLYELKGIRWTNHELEKTPLRIPSKAPAGIVIMMTHPRFKVKPHIKGNTVTFDIHVKVEGTIYEQFDDIPTSTLERHAAEAIEAELRKTFAKSVALKCDPYQLREIIYRDFPADFHRLTKNKPFFLDKNSLGSVKVEVKVTSTGKMKGGFNRKP
ncbi:Ger(x)C family spore germination protein [Brevibacillus centrosporus]|uniref:Ger(x)C family spore germination protein n=3 Tax=Brevibacillus centrosporus TaxID=54910 RepID=UPI0037F7ACE9